MKVKLVSVTKGVGDLEHMSAEQLSAYVARVSNPSNQMNNETASKLLNYCIEHSHWSVFEHAYMTVEITTSRAIAAQILRHRSATFQEFSQRYAAVTEFETYPARRQDKKNRQNSLDDMSEEDLAWFLDAQIQVQSLSTRLYQEALDKNIAKEQARFLLPLGTSTTLYMTNNLRNWIHYLDLRTDVSTQKEHRDIALAIQHVFCEQFPAIGQAKKWL